MAIIKLNATRGLEGTLPAVSGANLTGISAGKVLQVVSTKKTDTFGTSSETHVDVTGLTANITPSATANKVFVMLTCGCMQNNNGNARAGIKILRGSTDITVGDDATGFESGAGVCGRSNDGGHHQFGAVVSVLDSPSTTSATTYKVQMARGPDAAGTVYLNRSGNQDSNSVNTITTLTLMEIEG
jgi:hypothetical protein|tara:strand:+ start:47 stop:601 length:555 start_codon:yes stop_codon:yes gene_type:complete